VLDAALPLQGVSSEGLLLFKAARAMSSLPLPLLLPYFDTPPLLGSFGVLASEGDRVATAAHFSFLPSSEVRSEIFPPPALAPWS